MGEGVLRREGGGGVVMQGLQLQGRRTGLRIVLGALCIGAVVGLSLAIALPATQAAEQVSEKIFFNGFALLQHITCKASEERDTRIPDSTSNISAGLDGSL